MSHRAAFARFAALASLAALASAGRAQDSAGLPGGIARAGAERPAVPDRLSQADGHAALDRALDFLVDTQREQGNWGTSVTEGLLDSGYAVSSWLDWQIGAQGLACVALMDSPENDARRNTLYKAMRWLLESEPPKRGNDWDNDTVWAALYTYVACARAAADARFQAEPWKSKIAERAKQTLAFLARNQVPEGGWGYYDFPLATARPKWATSFTTAALVPALLQGGKLGWNGDAKMTARAVEYVRRCALPNGAYEYDLTPIPRINGGEHINDVKGSLGRIQVCNWALYEAGVKSVTLDKIREGLTNFMKYHAFLDVARMRPIPHEAYYANAGYFYFFGHYYAALCINLLPEAEREEWHQQLRPHLAKTLRADGSTSDYHVQSWGLTASTAFAAAALALGLPPNVREKP